MQDNKSFKMRMRRAEITPRGFLIAVCVMFISACTVNFTENVISHLAPNTIHSAHSTHAMHSMHSMHSTHHADYKNNEIIE